MLIRTGWTRATTIAKPELCCLTDLAMSIGKCGLRGVGPLSRGLTKPALYRLSLHQLVNTQRWESGFEPSYLGFCKPNALPFMLFSLFCIGMVASDRDSNHAT